MADLEGINGQREDFRVVGKPNLPGRLSRAIATGIAKFGIDYVVPNMLEAKFMRSPYAHARIKSYNKEKEDENIRCWPFNQHHLCLDLCIDIFLVFHGLCGACS